jgi:hypothetical protein
LSADDICCIIEACFRNKVYSLSYNALEIKFGPDQAAWGNAQLQYEVGQPEGGETPSGQGYAVPFDALPVELTEEDKLLMEEVRLGQLMTDDPMAYEQEMIDSHIATGD